MKENVQTIVGILEVVTFVITAAIAWFVWRISTRASKTKSKQGN